MSIDIRTADLTDPQQAAEFLDIMQSYAQSDVGNGRGLSETARENLPQELARLPHAFTLLARRGDSAVGLANCFLGFSTFACRPLVNLHDLAVLPQHQGQGIGAALLEAVAAEATRRGCCKVTLEVLTHNHGAQRLYERQGFTGSSLFLERKLSG